MKVRRALISVYDKTGVVEFARALHEEFGVEIISTGGTAKTLHDAGIPVTLVETLTGCGEMLDGRVKTLHPAIHAAILADRDNPEHMRQLESAGIKPIDMVVVNLYPFEQTVADPNCTFEQAIEMIDIGGVALLRAAAKNHRHVIAVASAIWNDQVLEALRGRHAFDLPQLSHELAKFTFVTTRRYDQRIWDYMSGGRGPVDLKLGQFDSSYFLAIFRDRLLRYGENAHQPAAAYTGVCCGEKQWLFQESHVHNSVPMSYNNYLDADAALGLCSELARETKQQAPGENYRWVWTSEAGFEEGDWVRVDDVKRDGLEAHSTGQSTVLGTGHGVEAHSTAESTAESTAQSKAHRTAHAVFVKHTNACGVGVAMAAEEVQATPDDASARTSPPREALHAARVEAYRRAYLGDPNAAMGGVLAVNFVVDAEFAATVMETYDRFGKPLKDAGAANAPGGFFVEVWIAPSFTDDAVSIIRGTYDAARTAPPADTRDTADAAPACEGGSELPRVFETRIASPPRKKWGENVRLLAVGDMTAPQDANEMQYRSIAGGMLVQSPDALGLNEADWKVVTQRSPTDAEMADLRLAWLICKHTKSNAITLVKDGMLIGNGAGQMSRVMSCRVATWLARENGHVGERGARSAEQENSECGMQNAEPGNDERRSEVQNPESGMDGPVAASDAFFPFSDGPRILIDAGVTAMIQPGGSKRDQETIDLCNQRGVAMIFTGTRHFRH